MKTEIEVAISVMKIISKIVEVELPTEPKYYAWTDVGTFFPRGLILFAIIPQFKGKSGSYLVVQVERGKQDYTDFVPTTDCKQKEWMENSSVRKTAFEIITGNNYDFQLIEEAEFESKRIELLNAYKNVRD